MNMIPIGSISILEKILKMLLRIFKFRKPRKYRAPPSATIGEDTSDRSGSACWIFRLARWDAAKRAGQPLVKVHLYHHPLHGCHRSIELCRMSFDESLLLNEACRIATDFVHAVTLGMEMPAPKPPEALTCPP